VAGVTAKEMSSHLFPGHKGFGRGPSNVREGTWQENSSEKIEGSGEHTRNGNFHLVLIKNLLPVLGGP